MITITWISVKMYIIGVLFHVDGNVNIKLVHYLGFCLFTGQIHMNITLKSNIRSKYKIHL